MYPDAGRISGYAFGSLVDEASYSAGKWSKEFDDKNTLNDWLAYIVMYASDAAKMGVSADESYKKLIKAANLCMLAATKVRGDTPHGGLSPRHYDAV